MYTRKAAKNKIILYILFDIHNNNEKLDFVRVIYSHNNIIYVHNSLI